MSLNWDATKASNWDKIPAERQEALIFATMFTDMGEITEANHREFYKRYTMFNVASAGQNFLTAEDVRNGIGLKTNVFTTTDAAYKKRLVGILMRHAELHTINAFKALETPQEV